MDPIKSIFDNYVYMPEITEIPERYTTRPTGFESYTWETQDCRVIRIKEIEDSHLRNIYNMLVKTILYAKDLAKHCQLSFEALQVVKACHHHLKYIGYELHLRQTELQQGTS